MGKRIRVLLTNDDGYEAPGLCSLYAALQEHYDVTVVAPASQQSGIGHAFTINAPVYCSVVSTIGKPAGYVVDGTPSDCVKIAISELLSDRPDLIVSGMNVGENSGVCGFYSGTVAAAREGALWEILSVAFSLEEEGFPYLESYCRSAVAVLDRLVELHSMGLHNPRRRVFFNVNFPRCPPAQCRGIRIARQSLAFFEDRYQFVDNGNGRRGFFLYGKKKDLEPSDRFDSKALADGYATITPLSVDATDLDMFSNLNRHEEFFSILHH